MDHNQIKAVLAKHNLTVESVFIPWSQSRNKHEKMPSLNWRVTLKQNGREIITTDYSAGCAHAPSYKYNTADKYIRNKMIAAECEQGGEARHMSTSDWVAVPQSKKGTLKPDSLDVIYSLLIDSEVLDYATFEDWAACFGYDTDSRKDEQVYNACLKIALQFRRIGESAIAELRDVYQGY